MLGKQSVGRCPTDVYSDGNHPITATKLAPDYALSSVQKVSLY